MLSLYRSTNASTPSEGGNDTTAAASTAPPPLDIIEESRRLCEQGDFKGAIATLREDSSHPNSRRAHVVAEAVRVRIIQGERKTAAEDIKQFLLGVSESSPASDDEAPFIDLLDLQAAFLDVSAEGKLASAIGVAEGMWGKYDIGNSLSGDEAAPEFVVSHQWIWMPKTLCFPCFV